MPPPFSVLECVGCTVKVQQAQSANWQPSWRKKKSFNSRSRIIKMGMGMGEGKKRWRLWGSRIVDSSPTAFFPPRSLLSLCSSSGIKLVCVGMGRGISSLCTACCSAIFHHSTSMKTFWWFKKEPSPKAWSPHFPSPVVGVGLASSSLYSGYVVI
jgi:hypothetical protein